jgi:predicted AlkP superfamily phosphohydrolase/phosphomutase
MNRRKVVAIGLDSAEPTVIEKWIKEGKLPNLKRIQDHGAYGRLDNYEATSVETSWTTFATGCSPEKTGYYAPLGYDANDYQMVTIAAYDYKKYPPFYALGNDYKVIAFDVPQVRLHPDINGCQVAAWGAHSPQVEQGSVPDTLISDIHSKFGVHPGLHNDYACIGNYEKTVALQDRLKVGIKRRKEISIDFVKNHEWDLFLTVFGEAHAAMHTCWHLSQKEHPLYEHFLEKTRGRDLMLEDFVEMDNAIGEIRDAAPDDVVFIVFSMHGMGPAFMDLSTLVFLPEYLYRYCFEGRKALGVNCYESNNSGEIGDYEFGYWERHIWNSKYETNLLKKICRRYLHNRIYSMFSSLIDPVTANGPISPFEMNKLVDSAAFHPAHWYKNLWPEMKAFAIPSFGEGYVRVNVKGRDPHGIVEAKDYQSVCDEITGLLNEIVDPYDGQKLVNSVLQIRDAPIDENENPHFADLIVLMKDKRPPQSVAHPNLGNIGPLPRYRSGTHRHTGFILVSGEGIEPNSMIENGHALDVAPTILHCLGARIPEYIDGKAIVKSGQNLKGSSA